MLISLKQPEMTCKQCQEGIKKYDSDFLEKALNQYRSNPTASLITLINECLIPFAIFRHHVEFGHSNDSAPPM